MIKETLINKKKELYESDINNPQIKCELIKYEVRKKSIQFAKKEATQSRNLYKDLELSMKKTRTNPKLGTK
jgi:hypothetical protein